MPSRLGRLVCGPTFGRLSGGTVAWTEVIDPSGFVWGGRSEGTARNDEDIEPVSLFNNEKFEVIRERRKLYQAGLIAQDGGTTPRTDCRQSI